MEKRKLVYDSSHPRTDRPYLIIDDNVNSKIRIGKIKNFESINEIMQDKEVTKALVIDNYFDTDYLAKIKKESIKYPVNKELEK